MRNLLFFGVFSFLVFLFFGFSLLSATSSGVSLHPGKNVVVFSDVRPFYVADLVQLNPSIEAVSYEGPEGRFGYVHVFSGVGTNFVLRGGASYEIIVSEETSLVLPSYAYA